MQIIYGRETVSLAPGADAAAEGQGRAGNRD